MAESYQVDPDAVRAHAKTMRGFQDRAGTAVDAGAHVAGLDDAYGILCQPFGSMVSEPQNRGVDALTGTRDATRQMADNLEAAAKAYEEFEKFVVGKLEQIAESVEAAGHTVPEVGNR